MANYTFGDTPAAEANQLQWHKIQDGDKTLLICDRVILVSCSWNDLNGQGFISGKEVTIDGAKYTCRVLSGGSNRRNDDYYAGGTPTANEWDRFITREETISGLPAPVSSDLDSTLNGTDLNSTHNKFWNWYGVYSWCQETYSENTSIRALRGYSSARDWYYGTADKIWEKARDMGIGVSVWTVNDPALQKIWLERGVANITTRNVRQITEIRSGK